MACNLIQNLHCLNVTNPKPQHFNSTNSNNTHITISKRTREISKSSICGASSVPREIISGEWPENFSLLNYDDLRAFLEPQIFKDKMEPSALLGEVMSTIIRVANVEQSLGDVDHHFEFVSGLPVVDDDYRCVGVVSKKDKQKASNEYSLCSGA
ncbi:hypothetical protein GIB67_028603 [Kingdonia uniflora]|uniref:CBS domain-containing protein n=1 Tax=Kingdonia uniflora TaxID=39325 RepID=A0A7J7KZI7_9MAGN|nr:hypothetical protein GIB67_028603 [Kingdonia uniflora]